MTLRFLIRIDLSSSGIMALLLRHEKSFYELLSLVQVREFSKRSRDSINPGFITFPARVNTKESESERERERTHSDLAKTICVDLKYIPPKVIE